MDGWMDSRADPGADPGFLSVGGGGGWGPGPTARIQDPHMVPIHTYVCYIHTHVQTGTCMFLHRQTDGHTCTCIDGKLEDRLFITCIIMYRGGQKHTCACMSRHTCTCHYLKISHENEWFGPIETNLFHFHRISKNGGHGGGSSEPHEPKLDPPLLIHVF